MTTMAWDGITIAHDSQATAGSLIMANQQKSFKLSPSDAFFICGELAVLIVGSGTSGDERYAKQFMRCAVDDVMEMPEELSFTQWVFTDNGNCFAIQKMPDNKYPAVYSVIPPLAAGCGRDFAMTAMYLGQNAEQAVITASVLDAFTDSNVKTYKFKHGEGMGDL